MNYKDEHILIEMINSQGNTLPVCFISQSWPYSISIKNILYLLTCIFYIFISRGKVKFCNKLREKKSE